MNLITHIKDIIEPKDFIRYCKGWQIVIRIYYNKLFSLNIHNPVSLEKRAMWLNFLIQSEHAYVIREENIKKEIILRTGK